MRVVIVSAVYSPEPVVSARTSADLAEWLHECGHTVTVICPQPSRPLGAAYDQYKTQTWFMRQEGGVSVLRVGSYTFPAFGFIGRLRESISFGLRARRRLRELPAKPDVVYANVWPLASQRLVTSYCKRHDIPLVLSIQDLYPESLLSRMGRIGRASSVPLAWFERGIAGDASCVTVASDRIREFYSRTRRLAPDRVRTIANWQDEGLFSESIAPHYARSTYDIDLERFTFLYLGNIGPTAGVELLIEAFSQLACTGAQLVIAGGGSSREYCRRYAERVGCRNIYFIADADVHNVHKIQSMADVCLLPLRSQAALSSVPSKLVAYMLSARPVLAAVHRESDTADVIIRCGCGWIAPPDNVNELLAAFQRIMEIPVETRAQIGAAGRKYALKKFSKRVGVQLLSGVLLEAARVRFER